MKKKTMILTVLLVIAVILILAGLVNYMGGSLPLQDADQAPASVIENQKMKVTTGIGMLCTGAIVFVGTIIGNVVLSKKTGR